MASAFLSIRLASFLAVPLVYWLVNILNYSQAGKTTTLGVFAILAMASWRLASPPVSKARAIALDTAVALPFFLILAIEAFLRDYFGTGPDDALVTEAVFSTNSNEAAEFFLQNSWAIAKHLGLLAASVAFFALAVWFSAHRFDISTARDRARRRRFAILAAVSAGIFLIAHFNPSLRRADPLLYLPLRYAKWHDSLEATRDLQQKLAMTESDPKLQSMVCTSCDKRTVIFVLGESTTRLNWSLYGYPRRTTPEIESISSDLIKFDDVITGYPGTEGSLKYIFTPATIQEPDLWMTQPDLLTMARRAGYKTFWLSNQGTRSGIISIFASHADVAEFTNKGSSRGEGSYDEILLPVLQRALDDPAPKKFIVLHMLGAHPVYHFRYPETFARFDSTVDDVTRQLLNEGRAFWAVILRNEYDNAMFYGDHFLRKTLEMARKDAPDQPITWMFAPDHGEDVAHYTNFVGHNHRVNAMYEVPMLLWTSPHADVRATDHRALASRPYQLDVLDNSLLGLMKIAGPYYSSHDDIVSPTFRPRKRTINGLPYR